MSRGGARQPRTAAPSRASGPPAHLGGQSHLRLLTQSGLRRNLAALCEPRAPADLAERGVPPVWSRSITTLLGVIDDLDAQIAPLDAEMRPHARADERVRLLITIPGVAELLGLRLAADSGRVIRGDCG